MKQIVAHGTQPFQGPPLAVRDLCKQYKGGLWANRGITFTAEPGEILGILGPNGAGKTTLVRQITTELLPTSGDIKILGIDVATDPSRVKSLLGIVPQEATLFDYLTVPQHLRIFGKLRGFSPKYAELRAEELVIDLHLTEQRNVPIAQLSGGQRRRVLIGLASLARPPLMVLDEPTTGLDVESRRDLWSLLRDYRKEGASVILTTHYMEEAEALCDRVGIIQDGCLIALDTVENLRERCNYQFKISYTSNGSTGETTTLFGAEEQELVRQVMQEGIQSFAVSRPSLEDVYLSLTGKTEGRHDSDG